MVQILIICLLIYFVGAVLLLERQCLGKAAFIQPLVVCLVAGLILGEEEAGLWFGVSLQLLSIGQSHYCNWALAAVISSASLLTLNIYDVHVVPGQPASLVLLCSGILLSILSDTVERSLSRKSAKPLKSITLWQSAESFNAFSKLIHMHVLKGFLYGGAQCLVGTILTSILVWGTEGRIQANPAVQKIVLIAIPVFGVAVTLGSMSGKRYPLFAGIGVALFFGMAVIM